MESNATPQLDDSIFRRFVIEHSTEPTLVLDAEGRVLESNQAALRGDEPKLAALFEAGASAWLPAFLRELRASGSAWTEVAAQAGATGRATFGLRGVVIGSYIVVSARDLSRERELEVELAHLRRLESIGMFTASVIHDLNNLLTPILCLSDLLRAQVAEGGSGLELSDEIRVAATRAASVINPLLAFVRGKPARVERLALRDVVVGLRPLIERLLGKRVELVLSLSEQGSTLADRQRFEHALLNLVANARDAMPNGGVLTIETVDASGSEPPAPPEAPAYVRLRVRDTGVGMSAEVQARVFERFYTTKEVGRGSGIGLAAVRKFVTESGGAIALDSTPGRGTAVTLLLPQVADLEATADPLPSIGETAGGRETILVVDEDEHVRKAVRASLERRRYRVIEADSADHALRLAEICGGRLDLVLVDAALRHFSASAFLQRLRTHVHRVRVLFMSGEAEDTIDMHDTLPTPILRKAFSAEALDRAVHAALSTTLG